MKEKDLIAETDYTVETECTETDHIVGIDHKTTIKLTIEKKIIGISKNRDIRENIKIIIKTHTTRITIELAMETRIGAKINTKAKTNTEMTAITKLEVGLKKKITYMMRMTYLTQNSRVHTILQTMSQEKEMAIEFMLAFSENPANILDSICSAADADHLNSRKK